MRLLVVDDDPALCGMLRDLLEEAGFSVECASDGAAALSRLRAALFNLVVLDVMMPGQDGFETLREMRRLSRVPVMLLTGRDGRSERALGFELGADDYLVKPFYPEELLGRVRAILRRSSPTVPQAPHALSAGEVALFPGTRNAYYRGQRLDLTAMECEILEQLLRAGGRVVSRDQLSLHLYRRPISAYDRSIDTHVSRIRRKLGEGRGLILSVRGTGYQLSHPGAGTP
jgi:DNA-binding response OmpR family regulator